MEQLSLFDRKEWETLRTQLREIIIQAVSHKYQGCAMDKNTLAMIKNDIEYRRYQLIQSGDIDIGEVDYCTFCTGTHNLVVTFIETINKS